MSAFLMLRKDVGFLGKRQDLLTELFQGGVTFQWSSCFPFRPLSLPRTDPVVIFHLSFVYKR